jgi:hypothetical protein
MISSELLYELIVLDGMRFRKFFPRRILSLYAGLIWNAGAGLVDSQHSIHSQSPARMRRVANEIV